MDFKLLLSHPWHHHHLDLLPFENHHPFHNIKVQFYSSRTSFKTSSALLYTCLIQTIENSSKKVIFLDSVLVLTISSSSTIEKIKSLFILRKDYFLIIAAASQLFVRSSAAEWNCLLHFEAQSCSIHWTCNSNGLTNDTLFAIFFIE